MVDEPKKPSFAPVESGELRLFEEVGVGILRGARILLAFDDPGRSDALAQELRALHAIVVVSGRTEQGLLRARDLDPEVVLVDRDAMSGPGFDLNEVVRNDSRLRWAALVVVRWEDIYPSDNSVAHMKRVASRVAPHRKFEEMISKMPIDDEKFDVPLERVGPARLLRALGSSNASLQVVAQTANRKFVIDLADGLIAGARLTRPNDSEPMSEGIPALAEFTELPSGLAHIERKAAPTSVNILLPYADALSTASREKIAQRHSVQPPKPAASEELEAVEPLLEEPTTRREVSELGAGYRFDDITTKPGSSAPPDSPDLHNASTLIREIDPDDATTNIALMPTADAKNAERIKSFRPPPDEGSTATIEIPKLPPRGESLDDSAFESRAKSERPPLPEPPMPDLPPVPPEAPAASVSTSKPAAPALAAPVAEKLPVLKAVPKAEEPARTPWLVGGVFVGVVIAGAIYWKASQPASDEPEFTQTELQSPTTDSEEVPQPGIVEVDAAANEEDAGTVAAVDAGAPSNAVADLLVANAQVQLPVPFVEPSNTPPAPGGTLATPLPIAGSAEATDTPLTGAAALAESERLYELGREAADANNASSAESNFLRAASIATNNPHPAEGLARLYLRQSRGADARTWADKLVALRRRRADYRVLLAEACEMAGDHAAAEAAYRDALEIDPNNTAARQHIGGDAPARPSGEAPASEPATNHGSSEPAAAPAAPAETPAPAAPATTP